MEQRIIYPITQLQVNLEKMLDDIRLDKTLQRKISDELRKKSLSNLFVEQLMNEQIITSQLTDIQIIALSTAIYNHTKLETINPIKYFSDNVLINYNNYIEIEEKIKVIEFKDFLKINDYKFIGSITYKQLYSLFKQNLIMYNFQSQRNPTFVKVGKNYLKNISVDKNAVKNIKETILKGKLATNEIILNCELIEGKSQNFKYEGDKLVDISILPDFNVNSENTTYLTILDGYNRSSGIIQAVNEHLSKTGEYLEGTLELKVVRLDIEEAKNVVLQSLLKADTNLSEEFKESLEENDYTKLISLIENKSNYLSNNIAASYEEMKAENKLITNKIMTDVIKYCNLKVENSSNRVFLSKKISENFDLILDYLQDDAIKTHTGIAVYFYIACSSKDDSKVLEKIDSIENELLKSMNKKNIDIKQIVSEVI